MRVVAIIQARTGSTRLPGKVLEDLAGEPMLARVVTRVRRATVDETVVATTGLPSDDVVEELCVERGWPCYRGAAEDVLDRYYQAAGEFGAEVVVRVTSDCPFIDAEVIDRVIEAFKAGRPAVDYAANVLPPRTFPRGLDVEVMTAQALAAAWREDDNPASREHVTPYLYRHPERFALLGVTNLTDLSAHRWTVDTPEDLVFARLVYEALGSDDFTWHDVLALVQTHPEISAVNKGVRQRAAE